MNDIHILCALAGSFQQKGSPCPMLRSPLPFRWHTPDPHRLPKVRLRAEDRRDASAQSDALPGGGRHAMKVTLAFKPPG